MNSIFLMYVPPFLPYFAFALIVVAGCWTKNDVAIWAGIIFMFLYDAKPEMEIISRTKVYQDCKFNIIDGENNK